MSSLPRGIRACIFAVLALGVPFDAAAQAQPYVYAITGNGVFRGGVNLTTLPPRLVTVDTTTGQAIASLTLAGCGISTGVAVRADGLRVFVSCAVTSTSGAVLAIDPLGKQILATRTFTQPAGGVAVTPAGDRLVVPMVGTPAHVLDAASLATLGTVAGTGTVFGDYHPVLVAADGSKAYLTESLRATGRLVVVNLFDFTISTTLDFSTDNVTGIALTGNGAKLVVGHRNSKLSIVNTATDTVEAAVPFSGGGSPAVAADGGARGFIAASAGVQVVDLSTHTVAGQVPPPGAGPLAMNAAADRLSAAIQSTGAAGSTGMVASINATTGALVSSAVVKGGVLDLVSPLASPAIAADACSYAIAFRPAGFTAPPPRESPAGSTDWRIDVIALPDRCAWTAQSDVPWITVEYTNGTGPDNVGITIAANTTGAGRSGTITIGGQTLTIGQAGCTNPVIFFERPAANSSVAQPYRISGWAIDTCAVASTGLVETDAVAMSYGTSRPDVAAAYGAQFVNSGFDFRDTFERRPGLQDISITFRDTLTGNFVTGTVRVNVLPSVAPFGAIDTPIEGQTVAGDMPLTGWAIDDVQLFGNPLVYRDALPGEGANPGTPGKVFIGVGTRVTGARPDVQGLYPAYADNDRAGFGLMVLTNALPNGGNGTFTFHVQITDRYNATWLGPRTVTVDNASSPLPFGAIDTPSSGQTVSGVILVQGWALTPGSAMIPVDGSTIDVIVDNAVVGHPTYNQPRSDVQALFPSYTNSSGPGGFFSVDTRTLSNGLHTIAWVVRDNAGHAKGIGSRYFRVSNP